MSIIARIVLGLGAVHVFGRDGSHRRPPAATGSHDGHR
jgi:hypothetical protein